MIDFWPRAKRRARGSAWFVWGIGVGVYFLGLFHRASLGVAGNDALDQLSISSTALGTLVMVHMGIYALMQVPAGLLIDRWGARRVLLAATLTMGSAQLLFALSTNFGLALLARGFLGAGDAAVFISVLRLVAEWFPRRRYALLTMVTALLGMLGNLVATVPLVLMLEALGWVKTFLFTGAMSCFYGLLLLKPALTAPYREPPGEASTKQEAPSIVNEALRNFRIAWRQPETRLGFWVHQSTMSVGTYISLLWGYPYLTNGLGYSNEAAASMLSIYVIANVATNFVIGPLAGRRPGWRLPLAFWTATAVLASILTLALWPGAGPPVLVVALTFAIFAAGIPASQIGFHLARDYNPSRVIGTATGVVNAGGFTTAMIAAVVIGMVLDIGAQGGVAGLNNYRWAFLVASSIAVFSFLTMTVSALSVRARALARVAEGIEVLVPVRERTWDRIWRAVTR